MDKIILVETLYLSLLKKKFSIFNPNPKAVRNEKSNPTVSIVQN